MNALYLLNLLLDDAGPNGAVSVEAVRRALAEITTTPSWSKREPMYQALRYTAVPLSDLTSFERRDWADRSIFNETTTDDIERIVWAKAHIAPMSVRVLCNGSLSAAAYRVLENNTTETLASRYALVMVDQAPDPKTKFARAWLRALAQLEGVKL